MPTLPIICANGIGDTLLVLGRVPIRLLGAIGFRFRVFYDTPEHPALKIVAPFFAAAKYLSYESRSPTARERWIFSKLMSLSQRIPWIWPVPLRAAAGPAAEPAGARGPSVLLHTHLDGHHGWLGATAKIWGVENWIAVIESLHRQGCDVGMIEWQADAVATMRERCPYVRNETMPDLAALCQKVKTYDCVVSIDSWVKYAAEWGRVPQVVIVPDLHSGYTPDFSQVTGDRTARWWFHGLIEKPRVTVLGLERKGPAFEYTLPTLQQLRPAEVLRAIQPHLPAAVRR